MSNKLYGGFFHIRAGDSIAVDAESGPCSGGARYGITEAVLEIDGEDIVTRKSRFSRRTGKATAPPWAYQIEWWIRNPRHDI
jgi:hypothetical protein